MRKSDKSIHNISIASIKRKTVKPYNFKWTNFYESNSEFQYLSLINEFSKDELVICSTMIDEHNFSIITTQRLITAVNGNLQIGSLINAIDKGYGDYKGYYNTQTTFGNVRLSNGKELRYLIETGNASMVMVYGIRTVIQSLKSISSINEKKEESMFNWLNWDTIPEVFSLIFAIFKK